MDPNFCFPKRRPVASRRAPADPSYAPAQASRESSALRASVLDAALLLGVGTNSVVTNWMFNNTLEEEEAESEITSSPGLTSGSTATSEESFVSSPSPFFTTEVYPNPPSIMESHTKSAPYLHFPVPDPIATPAEPPSASQSATTLAFEHNSKRDKHPRKLKKRRGDGYESDGGLAGDTQKKDKDKDRQKRADSKTSRKPNLFPEDRGYDTDVGRFAAAYNPVPKNNSQRTSKPKQKPSDDRSLGFETDDGNVSPSKPKKSRSFFRLPSKSSKSDLKQTEQKSVDIPPMPLLPPMPLPIAEKFASREGTPPVTPLPPISAGSTEVMPWDTTSELSVSTITSLALGKSVEETGKSSRRVGVLFTPKPQDSSDSSSSSGHSENQATSTSENVGTKPTISLPLTRPLSPHRHIPYPLTLASPVPVPRNRSPSPSSTIIPSSDYLVPSPAPSVLGYYDLPPPSPPPSGPLPPPPVLREPSRGRSPLSNQSNYTKNLEPGLFTRPLRTASPQSRLSPLRNPRLPTSPSQGHQPSFPSRPLNVSSPFPIIPTRKPSLPLIQKNDSPPHPTTLVSRPSLRGRESPFPAHPLPAFTTPSFLSQHRHNVGGSEDLDELPVKRRDLYHADGAKQHNLTLLHSDDVHSHTRRPRELHRVDGDGESVHDDNHMQDVLGRFSEFGTRDRQGHMEVPRGSTNIEDDPLGRNSYMGYVFDHDDDDMSQYPDDEARDSTIKMTEAVDSLDFEDLDPDARLSRYSALLYNRTSILDGERSMEARARFLSRIETMFDKSGRERSMDVPYVPKLPAGLGKSGSYVGRF